MILIIAAMRQELARVNDALEHAEEVDSPFPARTGLLEGREALVLRSGIGKVDAAAAAGWAIARFRPSLVINTGTAGALSPRTSRGTLRPLDVLLAQSTVQHDVDLSAFGHAPGKFPHASRSVLAPEHAVSAAGAALARAGLPHHVGVVGSGDRFVRDGQELTRLHPDIDAVDMEAAAIARACGLFGIPWLVARVISDTADHSAGDDFADILERASVRILETLRVLLPALEPATPD